jgi:hypothetical protein
VIRVGVAADLAAVLGDEKRQPLGDDVVAAARHLGFVGRIELEARGAMADVPGVDRGDRGDVGRRARADQDGGHG